MEAETAAVVAGHLESLGYEVHSNIGGHGTAGVFRNGPGKTVLVRAELDALPVLEQTDVPYRSKKRMVDRYGHERPVMHACGHDMKHGGALGRRRTAPRRGRPVDWHRGRCLPARRRGDGWRARNGRGRTLRLLSVPDRMLGQHVVLSPAGTVAIRSGPALVATDSVLIRVIGGPCEGSVNPQLCVGPIPLAMRTIRGLQEAVAKEVGPDEDATVACWGFRAGEPGNDYVAYADVLLDIKTVKADVRRRVLALLERRFRDDCRSAGVPSDPVFNFTVRAPLTNDDAIAGPISRVFKEHFAADAGEMAFTHACEDFSTLGAPNNVPYAYWNFGGHSARCQGACDNQLFPFLRTRHPAHPPSRRRCHGPCCSDLFGDKVVFAGGIREAFVGEVAPPPRRHRL